MRSRTLPHQAHDAPMSTINTTPLIDVMLVLLIMMILSIPKGTHKLPVDLPTQGADAGVPPPVNRISVAANGALSWNGAAVGMAELDARLIAHRADTLGPVLHIQTDPATPYDRFHETLAHIRRAGVTKLGFVGDAKFREW